MNAARLDEILAQFPNRRVLVVGDFFLDEYLVIDRGLGEISLETGLEAHQVVDIRCSPGAAGTVTSNLRALDVKVTALGVIGADGRGHDLKRELAARGVDTAPMIERAGRFTPTYTKPMVQEAGGRVHEIERLDIKNRAPMPADVEDLLIDRLRALVPAVDGVIVADQVQEPDCGVITTRVRDEISSLALRHPNVIFAADSRVRIGMYRHIIIKPNAQEATFAAHPEWDGAVTPDAAKASGAALFEQNRKPVFLTLGEQGVWLFTETGGEHIPAVPVDGEIDIVGAGDSAMASLVAALCSGASPREAAVIANLVASITIQQIGTTGTATPAQVRARLAQWQ